MTAVLPPPTTLTGSVVTLTPMTRSDIPQLYEAIGRRVVFESGYGGGIGALPTELEGFGLFVDSYYLADSLSLAWTVRAASGPTSRAVVGATWLGDFDLPNEGAHMGATAFSPDVWGTSVNPETKLLLLGLAFEHGFGRVKIQADSVNARSRATIERLGAQFEGILRREQRRADGSWRDTAVYSILAPEWPAIKAGLEHRIVNYSRP